MTSKIKEGEIPMKKLMIAIVATVVAVCADAKLTKNSTEAEFRAVADAVLACESADAAAKLAMKENLWAASIFPQFATFRSEYDARLAAKLAGLALADYAAPCWTISVWDKVSEQSCRLLKVPEKTPFVYSRAKQINCYMIPHWVAAKGNMGDAVGVLNEMITTRNVFFNIHRTQTAVDSVSMVKKSIQSKAEKSVKKWLRRTGRSFVTKDGVNPCAMKMEELNTALNAPRLAGLNEWLTDMGLEYRVDTSSLPSAGAVNELKEKVLDGDKNLDPATKVTLYICLGVDGYNAFVKDYNGDK